MREIKINNLNKKMKTKEVKMLDSAKKIVLVMTVLGLSVIWGMAIYFWAIFPLQETEYIAYTGIPSYTEEHCAKTANKVSQGECYANVAKTKRNEYVCGNIEIREIKDLCYVKLAEMKGDYTICKDNGVSPSLLSVCADYFEQNAGNGR